MTATLARVTNPRVLLVLAMAVGMLAAQSGRGTLAFFTAAASVGDNTFTAGTLSASVSRTGTLLWNSTAGGGKDASTTCATTTSGTLITDQGFTPGTYCVAPITVQNSGTIDAYLRLRLIRTAGATTGASQAFNNLLQLSVAEYTTATCNVTNFAPSTGTFGALTGFTYVKNSAGTEVKNLALTSLTANAGTYDPTATTSNPTANSYINLIGDDDMLNETTGNTATDIDDATSRTFCVAVLFPIGTAPGSNTTNDNAALGGTNTYAFQAALGQKSNR